MNHVVHPIHGNVKLGKLTPRHDARTLKMTRYAAPAMVPPKRMDWSLGVNDFGMMLNDSIGDCAVATPGHMIQAWSCNTGNEIVIPDEDIVKAYSAISGYVPGDDSTDVGCVMLDVMNHWRRTGIGGHKIDGYVALTPKNRDHIALSIDLFGGCALGFGLPKTMLSQEVWTLVSDTADGAPGSLGGHAVPALNYGPAGIVVVSWGKLYTVTWSFFDEYCDEAYGVLAPQWATLAAYSPGNVNYAQLQEDLKAIAG